MESMGNSIKKLEWRYAVKKFDPEKVVSPKKIDTLRQAFNLTATSYGLQPIKMLVLQNRDLQHQLLPFTYNQTQIVQASHILVICIVKNIDQAYIVDYFKRVKRIRGTNDDILEPYQQALVQDFENRTTQAIELWATNQAYLALGNLMTVCAIEKIDACPMEGFVSTAYNDVLGLSEKGLGAVLVMPIGHRAQDDFFSELKKVRKPLEDSVIDML